MPAAAGTAPFSLPNLSFLTMPSQPINLFGPAFRADPYPTYAELRTAAPLYARVNAAGTATTWFVTRYEDVAAILLGDRFDGLSSERLRIVRNQFR